MLVPKQKYTIFFIKKEITLKFIVNESCVGCGLCANICPQVFQMTDNGTAEVYVEEVDEEYVQQAQEAMEGCPVSAIEND